MLRLAEKYKNEVIPAMRKKFGYQSDMAVPRIEKVVVNTGFGRLVSGKTSEEQEKITSSILEDLAMICGQYPELARAKKSISGFKIRQGMPVGARVSLRRKMMYDFLERLIHIAFPRSRDFRGIDSKSLDKKGNLTVAIKEHITFPEILPERAKTIFGIELTVVTNAKTREESLELLKLLGFPMKG
jgi:large subunit ribosomal protein L5